MENPTPPPEQPKSLVVTDRRRPGYYGYNEYAAGPNPADLDDEPESGGLIEYWRILRRHKATWIIFAFVGALLGFLITLPQTPIYQARTSVEIVGLNENFMNFRQVTPVNETGTTSETSDIQTQVKILQSESLIDRVMARMKKEESAMPETPTRAAAWRKALHLPAQPTGNAYGRALAQAAGTIKVRAAGQTRLIEITVDSASPHLAADFANTLANEFIQHNLEARWKTTEKTSDWLTLQLDGMRVKLERSEANLQTYASNSGLLFTDEKTNVSDEKLRQLQQELSTATAERIAKQSRYEMAQTSAPDALPDILNDGTLREIQSKLIELRRQIAELGAVYTSDYSKLKRLEAEVGTLQTAFENNRADILKRIKNEFDEAGRREALLRAAYDDQRQLVSGQGEKAIQYNILKREVDSNRQLYDTMLAQLKESTIASAMRASNIQVMDIAKVPGSPYKPLATQNAGIGLLTGVFLGSVFIIVRERANRTIQQPGETPLYLNVPELGIIPSGKIEVPRRAISAAGSAPSGEQPTKTGEVERATWERKPSMLAESFRATLISILFASEKGSRPKVLVLTSAGPAEGKTTVASNLGIALAEVGQRVLVIDADLRRPRLHQVFGLNNDRGLSSLLREKVSLNGDRSLGGLIRESKVPGLFVVTSGPGTTAATNLLYGPYMPELLKYVRGEFDVVLVDTPPMLQIPDARVLGRIADKVIMVVRAGHTTRDAAIAARQRFEEDGTPLLGTILNDWNPKSSPNGYYGNYKYYSSEYTNYFHTKSNT